MICSTDDELLDLVNRNDTVIGTINRKDYDELLRNGLGYIRAADLFIMNAQGKLYVPIRTATKTIAPNGYDYSAGGHVGAGEDYLSTIIRETEEEIGIQLSEDELELVATPLSEEVRYIRHVYLLRKDVDPLLNPDDFISAEWLEPEELIKRIDQGHAAKDSLRGTVLTLLTYLQSN